MDDTKIDPEVVPVWAQEMRKRMASLEKENEMLKDMAGKNKVQSWEEARRDFKLKFCHFKAFDGKPIIGWGELDYSKFNPKGSNGYHENVFTTVLLIDGEKKEMNYIDFVNIKELVTAKLIEGLGVERSIVEFEDGKQVLVENCYLNA